MPGKLGTYHSAGLVFLLIAGGMTDGMAKIYEELGVGAMGALYGGYLSRKNDVLIVDVCEYGTD